MGLFTKVTCAICGKETRFSKTKLADGNYICGNCLGETYYMHDVFQGINASTKLDYKKMTLNDIKLCYEIRKQNLEKLNDFKCSKLFGKTILVDERTKQLVFFDYFSYTRKGKMLQKNPPIFKLKDIISMRLEFSETTASQTVSGKAKAESTAYLIFEFDDPVFDVIKVEIGKIETKSGFFGDKIKGSKEIEEIVDTLNAMRNAAIAEA